MDPLFYVTDTVFDLVNGIFVKYHQAQGRKCCNTSTDYDSDQHRGCLLVQSGLDSFGLYHFVLLLSSFLWLFNFDIMKL